MKRQKEKIGFGDFALRIPEMVKVRKILVINAKYKERGRTSTGGNYVVTYEAENLSSEDEFSRIGRLNEDNYTEECVKRLERKVSDSKLEMEISDPGRILISRKVTGAFGYDALIKSLNPEDAKDLQYFLDAENSSLSVDEVEDPSSHEKGRSIWLKYSKNFHKK